MAEEKNILPAVDLHIHTRYSDGTSSVAEMVEECIEKGIEICAITDHMDHLGHFMYGPAGLTGGTEELEMYIEEIHDARKKYGNRIKIMIGAEISDNVPKPGYGSKLGEIEILSPFLDEFNFFLIEGWFIDNPASSALNFKSRLKMFGFPQKPVILAHPRFGSIYESGIMNLLIKKGIGFELNSSKLSRWEMNLFADVMAEFIIEPEEKDGTLCGPMITVGSDAHWPGAVGDTHHLTKYLEDLGMEFCLLRFIEKTGIK